MDGLAACLRRNTQLAANPPQKGTNSRGRAVLVLCADLAGPFDYPFVAG